MLQARIQHASLPKHFQHSRTTMEEMKKLEIWKNSNWKKMEKLNVIFNRRCFVKATPVNSSISWMYVCVWITHFEKVQIANIVNISTVSFMIDVKFCILLLLIMPNKT